MKQFFIVFLVFALLTGCKKENNDPVDDSLAVPELSPKPGYVPFNTLVRVSSDVVGGKTEYSVNGTDWMAGDSLLLTQSANLRIRTRVNGKVSRSVDAQYQLTFNKVLIIGNSITRHPPAPQLEWYGDWGMAASAADKDYVSLLKKELLKRNPKTEFLATNKGSTFETTFWTMDTRQFFKDEKAFGADLIIMRIGDNVGETFVKKLNFEPEFDTLMTYLTENFKGKVVCTGAFFDHPEASAAIERVSIKRGFGYTYLYSINNRGNTAYGLFKDAGVASHPSDAGMEAISKKILEFL
ncbi:SGNH/GDSL hydrolase family protein [Siphonobacter aquaeclarae]|uniref:Lysophospholipase L1 n=1 Tax=Siphonobacter aquaeclarae TaxID=563176 RepID=A0A1G9IFJ3_9BACT|nr:SGNH/GDSL hydrolase family protein [Siphonobacter aquaeclarae]SDL24011.1 hypothetical protein SAMN04488090_0461 [Siphonobacter aquaeclarae]